MKRPWNLINVPVYSMVTYNATRLNMNLCTYVTPVSMHPKEYAVGVYHGTQTEKNSQQSDWFVLQLLHSSQEHLFTCLGRKSGRNFNKHAYLTKRNALTRWNNFEVLKDAAAWMLIQTRERIVTGDHDLLIGRLAAYKVLDDQSVLTLEQLRNNRKIRI